MSRVLAELARLPRVELLSGPTPLEHWSRLSADLGINLYVKRDDLMGIGAGGNKLRKLELLMGKARAEGVTWLLTTGGPQSNHARLTAAVAARLGLGCTLLLKGAPHQQDTGNILLHRLFGADLQFLDVPDYPTLYMAMAQEAHKLDAQGERTMQIPLGGATAEGTAAYVAAAAELADQLSRIDVKADAIVVAAGTVSTFAGLVLGAAEFLPQARVAGISVSWTRERLDAEAQRLMRETSTLLKLGSVTEVALWLDDGYIGPGYARISSEGRAAVHQAARKQGVLLDTTYTGKALAGLIGLVRTGAIVRGANVVFIHTGGLPELFARSPVELLDLPP